MKLQFTPCDWGRVLKTEQLAKDWHDLFGGDPVSRSGTAGDGDHTRLISAFRALKSRLWTARRRVQTQAMPDVKIY